LTQYQEPFFKAIKKTTKFIENFMSYEGKNNNKEDQSKKFHSFQFFKYHSFKYFTSGNYPQLFYGRIKYQYHITSINKYLKNSGYITGYSSELCMKENVRMRHNLPKDEGYDIVFMICALNSGEFNSNSINRKFLNIVVKMDMNEL
jgi:hypothetical protein